GGRAVELCGDRRALEDYIRRMQRKAWGRTGGIIQELVPPRSSDLRIIVCADEVVGAAVRVAAPGEWRTNVALGARSTSTTPPAEACELALAAARRLRIALAGIDLLRREARSVL